MTDDKKAEIGAAFAKAVNMTPDELEEWLGTPESQKVGFKPDGASESVGHAAGRQIVVIKRSTKSRLSDDDYKHMQKVVGFVARHSARRPENEVTSRWRYSLMNWGHDPIK